MNIIIVKGPNCDKTSKQQLHIRSGIAFLTDAADLEKNQWGMGCPFQVGCFKNQFHFKWDEGAERALVLILQKR